MVLGVLNACTPGARKRVGGIPLIARTLFHLNKLGLKRVVLLWDADHPPQDLKRWQGEVQVETAQVEMGLPAALLSMVDLTEHFLYVDAGHLIDPRLLQALLSASGTTLCYIDATDREKQVIRAGLLSKEDLRLWSHQGDSFLVRRAAPLFPGDIDPFHPEIRGPLAPYCLEVRSEEDARKATDLLIRSQQKQVMDIPARFIHPPLENALTALLVETPITPNGVTIIVASLGFLISWLFWHGYFLTGAFLTVLVNILDGVDGKLARTKLQYSWLGKHEDIIDYFYENSRYIALGWGLSSLIGGNLPFLLAAGLVLADTADNVFYTLSGKWYGKNIDLFTPFDRNFRCIAGRRNIYGIMFIIGFSLGYPLQTFATAAIWALVTATIHGIRLRQHGQTRKKFSAEGK